MALGRKPIEIVNDGKHQLLVKAKSWNRVYLGEIARIQNGFAFSSKRFVKSGGMPLIRIRDIDKNSTVDRYKGEYSKEFVVKRGDILIGMDGDFKAAIWKGDDALLNQRVCRVISASKEYDRRFLFLCLQPYLNAINEETSSVTVKHLSSRTIEEIPLPYPKLKEQQAIVSKIEELFSELDKGIENLRIAQQQLKTYRQSVLKWAFEGKLTEKWRNEKRKLTKGEVFVKHLNDEREQQQKSKKLKLKPIPSIEDEELKELPNLPNEFAWVRLGNLLWSVKDGPHYSPKYQSTGIPFISGGNIRPTGIDFSNAKFISEELHNELSQRCKPEKGDVLYTKGGTTGIARVNTYDIDFNVWVHVAVLKTLKSVNPFYLEHALNSTHCYKQSQKYTHGVGNQDLGLTRMILITLPICSYEEQVAIIEAIESRLSVADKMEESINQSLQQAEALRQSILKKAFEGRLLQEEKIVTPVAVAKVIPFERKVLAGKIIHHLYNVGHFGLTKLQKTLFLVEHHSQSVYETYFERKTAGPYDTEFARVFRDEMIEKGWFTEETRMTMTKFVPGENVGSLIGSYLDYFKEKAPAILFVLQLLKDKTTHEAELIATLYAVWNNRLIAKKPIKETELISDFFNWSPKKREEFQEEEVKEAYKWMKKVKLVPVGFGKIVF